MIPVTAAELYDAAFVHLDAVVHASGGIEELIAHPEKIPTAHIWGDVGAPWRCVAGAIYNVQMAGYPTVGFVFKSIEPEFRSAAPVGSAVPAILAPLGETHVAHFNLPIPVPRGAQQGAASVRNKIVLTSQNQILWNDQLITAPALQSNIEEALNLNPELRLEFEPEADVSYDFSAKVISMISKLQVAELDFAGSEKHCALDKDNPPGGPGCPAS
jgi:biopolymer transport protein ExbD